MDHSKDQASQTQNELHMLPCDQRYRTSKYFLEDQLRCSEAASDFRSVRAFFSKSGSFSFGETFLFQTQAVPIPVEVDSSHPKQR